LVHPHKLKVRERGLLHRMERRKLG
jgi:hypothetical protein